MGSNPTSSDTWDDLTLQQAYQTAYVVSESPFYPCQSKSEETQLFYQIVQNQLHFATTGKTAAEIIYGRADSNKPFMGLTTWKNSPQGKIVKSDVTIAKNYLNQEEVSQLNRLVNIPVPLESRGVWQGAVLNLNQRSGA